MGPIWFLVIMAGWLAVIVALFVILMRHIRRSTLAAREAARPQYDFGDSVYAWERACRKSFNWSHSRRNGGISNKKEAKG